MPPGALPFGLIGGTGRSGTTILRDVLARHPAVAAFPELRFPTDPDGLADFYLSMTGGGWSPYHHDVRVKRLIALLRDVAADPPARKLWRLVHRSPVEGPLGRTLERRYLGHRALDVCPSFLDRVAELEAQLADFSFEGSWTGMALGEEAQMRYHAPFEKDALAALLGGFWRSVAADSCAHAGASFFVEKETWSILWFDVLLRLVPEARLVHIIRDPRDVVASFTQQRWAPSEPVQAARYYQGVMDRWWHVRERVPPSSVLVIRLEDLVAEPRLTLESVCGFWDLPWHDALLAADLGHSRAGRWRHDLQAEAHDAVAEILRPTLEAYGYAR